MVISSSDTPAREDRAGVPYRSGDLLLFFGVIRVGEVVYHCRCIGGVEVVVSFVAA